MKILPVFIPHQGCPFTCVYCNQYLITKKKEVDLQKISQQIEAFCFHNKNFEKEIAFFGGTFTNLKISEQLKFLEIVKPFLDEKTGIRISTRPDFINDKKLIFLQKHGLTTLELGIQSFYDNVLFSSKRNYDSVIAINACNLIKKSKITLGIQLMPGLPDFSGKSLIETIKTTIMVKPEFVRIYPTLVLKDTYLEKLFRHNKYKPLELENTIDIIIQMLKEFKKYNIKVIKIGLHSDIDKESIIAGPYHPSLGELVKAKIIFREITKNYSESKTLVISKSDVSLFKGFRGKLIKDLKSSLEIDRIPVVIEKNVPKNKISFKSIKPAQYW